MRLRSTRSEKFVQPSQAIVAGISEDGGLFVPESFPSLDSDFFRSLVDLPYRERAKKILALFLDDFSQSEIEHCVDAAYTGTFEHDNPAPLVEVKQGVNLLELWHGPTCAFKDLALQLLPHLLTTAVRKTAPERRLVILTATSGDTGKAALAGFADVPGIKIIVFYPQNGVSAMQKLQMTTQRGDNVAVCAIDGNFDNAQSGVKAIFADAEMRKFLSARNMSFSSANSINFGRLVPQVVYYVSAYCDLLKRNAFATNDEFNVVVPTGNFGNILAAVYAKQLGVPIKKFICASNRNNILTDFIRTGVYDRNRDFYLTTSPSMDILISSNLERLLFMLFNNNCAEVASRMDSLKNTGRYTLPTDALKKLQKEFYGGFCDDVATATTISKLFREKHYLCDTHTAVAVNVYEQYLNETGDNTPVIIASTASSFKFSGAVLPAIYSGEIPDNEFEMAEKLSEVSGMPLPTPLAGLRTAKILHKTCIGKDAMPSYLREILK